MGSQGDALLVRFWAGARAAAGTAQMYVPRTDAMTVADVVTHLESTREELVPVLQVCALLLDGRAVRREEPVGAAQVLEVLPPFAGG
ncbi:MAG TPA: MoaD/ThiS family protein [Intrasporangiaceae bacterium]|nr:MoaD/ThiS family protein [Intrasporangiaceae bacterium]